MKKKLLHVRLASLILFSFFIVNCSSNKEKQNQVAQKITVITVEKQDIPMHVEFVGNVYGFKDIPIRARVDGYLEGIHFSEGLEVTKGQLLYSIDSQPFEAEVAARNSVLAEAQTGFVKARSDLNRYEPLAKTNAVSQSDYDAAVALFDASKAAVSAAKSELRMAEIQLGYTKIKSPISGIIGKTLAKEGEYVGKSPNPVILNTVSRLDNINVEFFIPENQYLIIARLNVERKKNTDENAVKTKERADVIELILSDGSLHAYPGVINFIDRGVNASTGAILVQASFPNPDQIVRPGQYAKVRIEFSEEGGYLVVPQRCIKELQGQHSVFVVNKDNQIESRQLVLGERVKDFWVVKEGLQAGEKIVIDALQKVANGITIEPEIIDFKSQFSNDKQ